EPDAPGDLREGLGRALWRVALRRRDWALLDQAVSLLPEGTPGLATAALLIHIPAEKAPAGWPGLSPRSPGESPNRGVEDSAPATPDEAGLLRGEAAGEDTPAGFLWQAARELAGGPAVSRTDCQSVLQRDRAL